MIFFPDEDAFENGPPAVDDFMDAYEAPMQDLLGDEIILAGSSNYTSNFNPRRDASYEELLHLAHGYGINKGMPALKLAIEQAATNAVNKGWYTPPPGLPKVDIPFEYFAFTMETWYGIWRHDPNNGEYVFSTRAQMEAGDPLIVAILEGFAPKYHVHRATLVPKFAGTFLTEDTAGIEYTYKSRYLTDVEIGGGKNNNVEGNDQPGFHGPDGRAEHRVPGGGPGGLEPAGVHRGLGKRKQPGSGPPRGLQPRSYALCRNPYAGLQGAGSHRLGWHRDEGTEREETGAGSDRVG
jgi:hypothetical protein